MMFESIAEAPCRWLPFPWALLDLVVILEPPDPFLLRYSLLEVTQPSVVRRRKWVSGFKWSFSCRPQLTLRSPTSTLSQAGPPEKRL